ncbi:hypothetical protein T4C_11777 [Trichinella pseudospiralis]|uniref:Uncharacterized protein n=1 Tax=Trichinella pseudospiralis TaxID=6337 RepID=A0A0V1GKU4_TRIPS|nr:hypothetical protein T4C_11777 [Trichinella pseudospiralis]
MHLIRGDSVSVLVVELEFCHPLYTTIFSWVSFTPRGDCARLSSHDQHPTIASHVEIST